MAGASMVYIFAFQIVNRMISAYGYPFYLIGSMLLFCDLPGCSPVIQSSSRVESFYLKNRAIRCRPLCVQKPGSMDDKHFLSYDIFRPEGQSSITVSRSSEKEYSFVTLCSTVRRSHRPCLPICRSESDALVCGLDAARCHLDNTDVQMLGLACTVFRHTKAD